MSGNDYKVVGTLSQSFIGISEDNKNKCFAGFWNNIEVPISVEEVQINDIMLKIFPNPFKDFTVIEFFSKKESDVELTLNNLLGQKITTIFNGRCKTELNRVSLMFDEIPVGVFYLQLKMEQYQKVLLVVKQ